MSIWARTLTVIIALSLILLTISLLLTAWDHVGIQHILTDRQQELQDLLGNNIYMCSRSLNAFAFDYTYWDELVDFMKTGDPVWAKENIEESMGTYDVSDVWIYHTGCSLHYSMSSSGETLPEIATITELLPRIFATDRLNHFFLLAPEGLLEIRGATIHPTEDKERKTPPQGFFIAGRRWDTEYLSMLGNLIGGSIEVVMKTTATPQPPKSEYEHDLFIISNELRSWDHKPVAWVVAHIPSGAVSYYLNTIWWSLGLNFGVLVTIVVLVALILLYWVVRPLHLIRSTLNSGNTASLAKIEWISTEFSDIAEVIRNSFHQQHALQTEIEEHVRTQSDLARRNAFIESVLESLPIGCNVLRLPDLSLQFMNQKYAEICGWPLEEINDFTSFSRNVFPDEQRDQIAQTMLEGVHRPNPTNLKIEEMRIRTKTGECRYIRVQAFKIPGQDFIITTLEDITEQHHAREALLLNENRMEALLELNQMSFDSVSAIAEHSMEKAIQLTQSNLGFVAFANEDETVLTMHAWSHRVMDECRIKDKPLVFPIESTGLWGEAVRQHKPIVVNDYPAENPLEKGYPEGHVALHRVMSVPIFDNDRIVVVAGLANKAQHYNHSDVQQLTLLMEGMWRRIQRKQAEDQQQWQLSLNAALADLYEPLTSPTTSIQETANLILQNAQKLTHSPEGFVCEVHIASGMILEHAMTPLFNGPAGVYETIKNALSCGFDETWLGAEESIQNKQNGFFNNNMQRVSESLDMPPVHPPLQRLLTLPIILESKHAGTITLVNSDRDYTDLDLHAVQRLAQFYALTIQRKRLEADLRRLAAAIEQAAEIVIVAGVEGEVRYVNPAYESIRGRSSLDVLGEPLWAVLSEDASQHNSLRCEIQDKVHQTGVWSGPITIRTQDSTPVRLQVMVSPVYDDCGVIANLVAIARDVTWEFDLQEQLRHAQKMEAVGQLAGGVAHDFNNLLQVITGYTDLAMAAVESESLAAQSLQEILNASERARTLVNQLLLFGRRKIQQPKNINLSDTVENAMKLLGRVIGEHIERVYQGCDAMKPVCADPNQILQVLMNLCVNAQDAMPNGGRLTIAVRMEEFDESFCAAHPWAIAGEFASLSVSDTGTGMPPEILTHIFEPFFSTKEAGKGTGLGLATVYGIVKQHDGLLHVESEVGKGSVFSIYLPVSQDAVFDEIQKIEENGVPAGQGERILLAEDEENVRYLTSQLLRNKGYRPIIARDGEEAIQLFQHHMHELKLVVVDAVMPKKSGRDVYDAVRACREDLPILFVSGYSYEVLEQDKKLINAALLQKPFRLQALLSKIREMLDGEPPSPTG